MRVVFTAAVMDLCHRGHLNLLNAMRQEAGIDGRVIVILHDDKSIYETKGRIPLQNFEQRKQNLLITGLVDEVILTTDYRHLAKMIEYVVEVNKGNEFLFMRGDDWQEFPARTTLEVMEIPIKFIKYTEGVTSTLLRKELANE